jgi:hypothetical protein
MVLFVLSVIVAAIVVAISQIRRYISFGSLTRSEIARGDFSIAKGRSEKLRVAGTVKQFLVVVLPDGRVVNPRVAELLESSIILG